MQLPPNCLLLADISGFICVTERLSSFRGNRSSVYTVGQNEFKFLRYLHYLSVYREFLDENAGG